MSGFSTTAFPRLPRRVSGFPGLVLAASLLLPLPAWAQADAAPAEAGWTPR